MSNGLPSPLIDVSSTVQPALILSLLALVVANNALHGLPDPAAIGAVIALELGLAAALYVLGRPVLEPEPAPLPSMFTITAAGAIPAGVLLALDREEQGRESTRSAVQEVRNSFGLPVVSILTLSDLIGGIESVTLGDEEARRRGTQKTILERRAPPTFEVLIEIQGFQRLAVHEILTLDHAIVSDDRLHARDDLALAGGTALMRTIVLVGEEFVAEAKDPDLEFALAHDRLRRLLEIAECADVNLHSGLLTRSSV